MNTSSGNRLLCWLLGCDWQHEYQYHPDWPQATGVSNVTNWKCKRCGAIR